MGFFHDQMGFTFLAISVTLFSILILFLIPNELSLLFVFIFIYFQGFFKIVSNYHPIVHLGADLVLIALIFKVLIQRSLDSGIHHFKLPPLSPLFFIHFLWVGAVFFNPYSLGFVPSLAGSKVYISMFTLFFFGYYLTKNIKDIHKYFILFIALAVIQLFFTLYQGFIGVDSVISIHSGYQLALMKYERYAFRPFGLTNLPGAPSVYIYPVVPFVLYFLYFSQSYWVKLSCLLFLPLAGLGLFLCQVRSAIIKGAFAVTFLVVTFFTSRFTFPKGRRLTSIIGTVVVGALLAVVFPKLIESAVDSNEDNSRAVERSFSSFDMNTFSSARRGAWDRFMVYIETVPFGAGFSRTGASSGAFQEANLNDRFFSKHFFFADNLFLTLLIEIGLPGLILVTLIILMVLGKGLKAWRQETRQELIGPQLSILSCLFAIFIGSYGAEGIVYNPESAIFWFFSGVLLKTLSSDFSVLK